MRISDRIKKLFGAQLGNSTSGAVIRNYGKNQRFTPESQVRGITYKAIDKVGQTVSTYQPKVLNARGDALKQHQIIDLDKQPNPRMAGRDFKHLYGMLYEIYGETFWYLAKGETSRAVKEIYLLNPSSVELKINAGEVVGYVLHKQNGEPVPFTLDEIIHDMRPNPFNPYRGLSILERASEYVDTENTTTTFTLNYMRNNASPSGVMSLPNMSPETFTQFTQQWRENYEGAENAGKTAFIRGGEASFKAVGATLKDVDAKVTRDMSKEDILMMFDMPKALLGISEGEGLGRASIETHKYIYAENKLEPMMLRLDDIYQRIANMSNNRQQVIVTHESPVPEDKEFEHKQVKELTNIALTVNEARAMLGLEPLPDPEFNTIQPRNALAPQAESAKAHKIKVVAKSNKPVEKKQSKVEKADENERNRKQMVKIAETYAKEIQREIAKFANKQGEGVISRISASEKAYEEWLFSIKEESEVLASLVTPVVIELMEEQTEAVAHWITGELLTISPEIRQATETQIKQIAGVYNEDTYKALERTITAGRKDGETLVQIKKRVESVYQDAQGYRAERIARTESLRASNQAAELTYRTNGFKKVEWFTNPDACEFCKAMAAQPKSIGSKYLLVGDVLTGVDGGQMRIEYDDVGVPPLHPNCRCNLIPVAE